MVLNNDMKEQLFFARTEAVLNHGLRFVVMWLVETHLLHASEMPRTPNSIHGAYNGAIPHFHP